MPGNQEHSTSERVKQAVHEGRRILADLTDEELILEFQNENEAAFTILVTRYKDPLTNFVYRFTGDWDECSDVVQEAFIRVFRNRHSYKPVAKFSTWLYTIATNLAKTQLRRRKIRRYLSLGSRDPQGGEALFDIPDETSRTDALIESSLREESIQKALNALPEKYREIIILRDVQELSYEEIAEITRLNIGTVKSRINRGRTQLQEMLRDIWDD